MHGGARFLIAAGFAALMTARADEAPAPAPTGLQTNVVFDQYTPLSASSELVRRLLSPLAAAQVAATLTQSSQQLLTQSIDLSAEHFILYVPPQAPAQGYALLVFVPPWDGAHIPDGWQPILERYGMIFVSAARSGNDENTMGRREPLALLAAYNVMQRYRVDPQHVYVGGHSGGSRIAMRLALAYPDLFRGAFLNAGADPLGAPGPPVPPADLMQRFQESSRLVYVTGDRDPVLPMDGDSRKSMRDWCVFNVTSQITPWVEHHTAAPGAFETALHALVKPADTDPGKIASCRSGLQKDVNGQLDKVQALLQGGRSAEAQKLLTAVDQRYGGLAAPRSVQLQASLAAAGH
jgi:hypothetical protein